MDKTLKTKGIKEGYLECVNCNKITADCEATDTDDGLVCAICRENHYFKCKSCNNMFNDDNLNGNGGDYYCEDCWDDLPYCERCNERDAEMELSTVQGRSDDESWCEGCREDYSFCCDRCEQNFADRYYGYSDVRSHGVMCEGCCERIGTFECETCDRICADDDRYFDDDDDDNYQCRWCAASGERYIHNYSYKPSPKYKYATNQQKKDNLFFGIELEVERKESSLQTGKMAEKIANEDIYYIKNDGSLECGFEIVTHPMTFEFIQENKEKVFKSLLDKLLVEGYRSYDSNTCGIHIHLTKKCFSTWQLYRFIKFFVDNREFVTTISQREIEQLERWATIEEESTSSIIYKAKKKDGNSRRYSAVNLQNSKTVEIRIFRGTLNYLSFLKNVEFCYALYNFSRDIKDTTVQAFKEYIEQSSEYSMLKKFIKSKNI